MNNGNAQQQGPAMMGQPQPQGGGIGDVLQNILGGALFVGSLADAAYHGGVGNVLSRRAEALSNPDARGALQGSPFTRGTLGIFGALPALSPEQQVAQQVSAAEMQQMQDPAVMEQVARSKLGLQQPPPAGAVPFSFGPHGTTYRMAPPEDPNFQPIPGVAGEFYSSRLGKTIRERAPRVGGGAAGDGRTFLTQSREFDPRRMVAIAQGLIQDPNVTPDQARAYITAQQQNATTGAADKARAVQAIKDEMLTNPTRSMVEGAPKVIHFIDRIENSLTKVSTGPFWSRANDIYEGKIGAPDPEWAAYMENLSLMTTALVRMHGQRGRYMVDHFKEQLNGARQSAPNMRGALEEIRKYAEDLEVSKPVSEIRKDAQSRLGVGGATPDDRTKQLDDIFFPQGK